MEPLDKAHDLEAVVWADARSAVIVQAILRRMAPVRVVALGGPPKESLGDLAGFCRSESVGDDLRRLLLETPARFLLLASAEGFKAPDLQQVLRGPTTVLAMEPASAGVESLAGPASSSVGLLPAPWLRMSPAWTAAAQPQEALGAVRSAALVCLGPPGVLSLYAHLYNAMETAVALMGPPEFVGAALEGPAGAGPAGSLRALEGHLTVHLRFESGASAVMHLSDKAGGWMRRMTVLGQSASLDLEDGAYRLTDPEGHLLESMPPPKQPLEIAELVALQWQRIIERGHWPQPAPESVVVGACQTVALACRTGQVESTRKFMDMAEE